MSSREPRSTRPKLTKTSSSHSLPPTDIPSTRLQATEVSPDKFLTTSRTGMPFHETAPTPQCTNPLRDADSDPSSVSAHFTTTATTGSTISSELHSRDLDNSSYRVHFDDISVPLDARILTAPSFQ
ncbi:hypothetical protein N7447_002718 [Penicillium robsamsonii]|uniref:uncharacterized protein n=1 Tax=Penicillium robsamsonii TaxID=1792511 RepID=UPI00254886D3|nr:uncharacterized protein N7447_002718 [Penicillium robsamsonii]KAJ5836692.1 hypothetical protein N7447_002718 [Penicillium robsamsonii]